MNENKESFSCGYSAPQQSEIKKIREKYIPAVKKEDKMELLRRLDKSASVPGTTVSLIVGIIGVLVMGAGMSFIMVWGDKLFVSGIIIGIIGMLAAACAYPIYGIVTKRRRKKLAPQIMKLTDELMEGQ